jgi:phage gp29-like protein
MGRILYPLVKFRRRAIESYVLYGDRYATPTAVAMAPLSASTKELDTLYDHLSNLSQETAMVLPEGYELNFVTPSGSPDVFKGLIEYVDKEISVLLCGENEAGQAEAGSRASSQVANVVRVVKAAELSEMVSQTLTQSLIRWIVDLNFGVDVAAPSLTREFRIEESPLTMPDVSLLIQSGYTPKKEWIERHFRVELQDATDFETNKEGETEARTTYDPNSDEDLYGSIFGNDEEMAPEGGEEQQSVQDLDTGEEVGLGEAPDLDGDGVPDDQQQKPFGDEEVTEDEATDEALKEG